MTGINNIGNQCGVDPALGSGKAVFPFFFLSLPLGMFSPVMRGYGSPWSLLQVPVTHHPEGSAPAADSLRPSFPVLLKAFGLT